MSSLGGDEYYSTNTTEPGRVPGLLCLLILGAELALFWWLA